MSFFRNSRPEKFCKKVVLQEISQNSQEFGRSEPCDFIKKEALAQVFSCEFCETSKNAFFYRTLPVAVSVSEYVQLGF